MHVKCFVRLLTLFGALTSSNGLKCGEQCDSVTVSIALGSTVSLPCLLQKTNQTNEATWSQNSSLLSIRPDGNITFDDPRSGRVTVFPYLFDRGNFSILIHELQPSDVGMYCCQLSRECHRVEILLQRKAGAGWNFPWYYIVAGIGGLILLMIACSLAFEFRGMYLKRSKESYYVNSTEGQGDKNKERTKHANAVREESDGHYEDMEGDTHREDYENMHGEELEGQHEDTERHEHEEDYVNTERGSCEGQYIDSGRAELDVHHGQTGQHRRSPVYENDEHNPHHVWISPQPRNNAFRETSTQPNSAPPYYANQSEISKAANAGQRKKQRKRKKQAAPAEYQFRNPIYGDSGVEPQK